MTKQFFDDLRRIVGADLFGLEKNIIFPDGTGHSVFGTYFIQKEQNTFVVYKQQQVKDSFSSTKTALSWCIADKYNQHALRDKIASLDLLQTRVANDVQTRSDSARRQATPELREIATVKVNSRKDKLQHINNELDKCTNLAKYWQIRGFNNEIARTRRPAPNRTNY
jgi:hypothetical protein